MSEKEPFTLLIGYYLSAINENYIYIAITFYYSLLPVVVVFISIHLMFWYSFNLAVIQLYMYINFYNIGYVPNHVDSLWELKA